LKLKKTLDYEFKNLKDNMPIMNFDGSIPLSEWKKSAKTKLTELLGLPLKKCENDFEIEYEKAWEKLHEMK